MASGVQNSLQKTSEASLSLLRTPLLHVSKDLLQGLHSEGTLALGCSSSPDLHICSFLIRTWANGSSIISDKVVGVFCVRTSINP